MTRLYDRLIAGLATLAGLLIAGICILIAWDVLARNVGWQPPASTVALTEYALLYFTMAAAPYLVRCRGHIVVEVLYQRLGRNARRGLDMIIPLACAVICALVTVLAMLLAAEAWQRGEIDVRSLDTPRWLLFAPLAAGFGLMSIEFLRLVWRRESVFEAPDARRETF
jgi:TRAP-type C4-dicarboxylate transport system permease small subunit